jgi:phosphoribosyl 1,2-cyclic phosphodiesterase
MGIKITFWGCSGSFPAPISPSGLKEKIAAALWLARNETFKSEVSVESYLEKLPFSMWGTYKGNTTCVQIHNNAGLNILCDAGSGIGNFAQSLQPKTTPQTYHLFISHLHWDHIQGFPFFTPIYQAGNKIYIHGSHSETENSFRSLMQAPNFPADYDSLKAEIIYDIQPNGATFDLGSLKVKSFKQVHPNDSYGYRFEEDQQSVVFSTDSEHSTSDLKDPQYPFLKFIDQADLLIFDGQCSAQDSNSEKPNWGHSDALSAVELAAQAGVKKVILMHHECNQRDSEIEAFIDLAKQHVCTINQNLKNKSFYPQEIILAHDEMVLEL